MPVTVSVDGISECVHHGIAHQGDPYTSVGGQGGVIEEGGAPAVGSEMEIGGQGGAAKLGKKGGGGEGRGIDGAVEEEDGFSRLGHAAFAGAGAGAGLEQAQFP